MKLSIAIVLSLLIFSCAQETTTIEDQSNKEFQKVDSLIITFDEIGAVDFLALGSYYDENGGAVAIHRTSVDRSYIDIYDIESGELLNKIPIEYEGPDGVGNEISKIHMLSVLYGGEVNFEKSNNKKNPCQIFVIENQDKLNSFEVTFEYCDIEEKVTVIDLSKIGDKRYCLK